MSNYNDDRRWEVERIESSSVQARTLSGKTMVTGLGEFAISIQFPWIFVDPPGFYFGGELEPGAPVVSGSFPTLSAIISGWEIIPKQGIGTGFFYTGASLAVVVSGDSSADTDEDSTEQELWVHWHFTGSAFQNPVDIVESGVI